LATVVVGRLMGGSNKTLLVAAAPRTAGSTVLMTETWMWPEWLSFLFRVQGNGRTKHHERWVGMARTKGVRELEKKDKHQDKYKSVRVNGGTLNGSGTIKSSLSLQPYYLLVGTRGNFKKPGGTSSFIVCPFFHQPLTT